MKKTMRGGEGARGRTRPYEGWRLDHGARCTVVSLLLVLLGVVCCLRSAYSADWTSDERLIASVKLPQKSMTITDFCAELGLQTSSEFYVDRREGDRKIAWFAGDVKLKTALSTVEAVTGLKWRMVGDMFFLCRESQGAAIIKWNERYAEAKKIQLAGIERKRVKDWVNTSMPFPAKYDLPWQLTPLQREQLAFSKSLLFYTMTPPQLNWLDAAFTRLGYEPTDGQTTIDQAVSVTMDAPVKFNAGMIIHSPGGDYLIEMPLSAQEEAPKQDEAKPAKVAPDTADSAGDVAKKLVLKDPVKGLWLTDDDLAELPKLAKKAKSKGFNTIYIPTLRSGHTIYPSKQLPQDGKLKGADVLRDAIKTASGAGMKVYAVLDATLWGDADHPVPPAANYQPLYERNLLGRTFAEQDKWQQAELKAMQPDAPAENQAPEEKRVYMCPASSRLPRLLASVAEEIAGKYDVAGICLDGVDYVKAKPFMVGGEDIAPPYGYTLEVRREMIRLNQVDPIDVDSTSVHNEGDAEAFALFDKFRRGHLTGLLTEVSTVFKAKKAGGIFSATMSLSSDTQSPAHWSKIAGLDVILPLAEIRSTTDPLVFSFTKDESEAVVALHRAALKNAAVVPVVVGLSEGSVVEQMAAVSDVVKAVKDSSLKGYILQGDAKVLSSALDMLGE